MHRFIRQLPAPADKGIEPVNDPSGNSRFEIKGRLGFATFFKVCFIGVIGSSAILGLLYLLVVLGIYIFSSSAPSVHAWDVSWKISAQFISLAAVNVIVGAILTGLLGYPLYKWLSKIRGGLQHKLFACGHEEKIELKHIMRLLRPARVIVPASVLIAVATMLVYLPHKIPIFSSETSLLLSLKNDLEYPSGVITNDYVETQTRIIDSRFILKSAQEKLSQSAEDVSRKLRSIQVNRFGKSSIIRIRVASTDPIFSADFANAVAAVYREFKAGESGNGASVEVGILEMAVPNNKPVGPTRSMMLGLASLAGGLAGLVISILLAAVRCGIFYPSGATANSSSSPGGR
jgi:capsular polysaccharide biosynthesis protein